MSLITDRDITRITDANVHPTTSNYIKLLLNPYIEALNTAFSIESVVEWVPLALGSIIPTKKLEFIPNNLSQVKNYIKEELLKEFLKSINNNVIFYKGDNLILPWDVKESMSFEDVYLEKFGVTKGDFTLPVIINNQYEHQMNEETAMGLLLYSYVSGNPIDIKVYGVQITPDYYQEPNRYTKLCSNARRSEYSILIEEHTYCFITLEFLQGFATGASWFNDDHRKYWTNLISYELDPKGIQVTF